MKRFFTGLVVLIIALPGTTSCTAKKGLGYKEHQERVYGHVADVRHRFSWSEYGEMIALEGDSLILLTRQGIVYLKKDEIKFLQAKVSATSSSTELTGAWGGLIWLWSFGHGMLASIALPINTVGALSVSPVNYYEIRYPGTVSWEELKLYSRFPQGLPEGCDVNSLRYTLPY